ncbi:uncharacterized protein LOC125043703 [Penaeus chinensis]|uniref:uncharacterized protein LOC125043703 n=1 Tax=Penaeus chinensis TaxID=139456 RepID=UPI001FB76D19|nr:uncharacterized protein LOC125043703 [Penaeus chinensis]
MSEPSSDGSPGRQRRSTERSRENIREYVKLLSRKVTGSPSGHRTPRLLREVKMSDGGSGHKSKSEGDTSTSPAHMKLSSKNQESVKEKQLKKGIMQTKKIMKSKKSSGSTSVSVSGKAVDKDEAEKSGVITKVNTSKEKLTMPVLKSARTQDRDIEPSTSKDVSKSESADNSVENESDIDSISCFEDFDKLDTREEMQSQQKTMERNKVSTPEISSKRSTPKSGRGVDCKSDSPPDLILFLKEGRGRAQNYSEPPTLESETIATRRRTRVPADPKTIDISKKINASQPKGKKYVKGVQKKESKREKLKVLETPESLKRLAQGLPLKDQSKSPVLVKQETPKTSLDVKLKKRIMLKNIVGDKILKQERTSTPVSEEDGSESEDGRKRRGRRRGHSSESTSSIDESQLSPVKMLQGIQVDHEASVDYLNLDSVLQKVPDNMASDKIPIVIMSNSDQEDKPSKAMPKSRKSRNFLEDKAKTRAFMKLASSSSENSLEGKEELMTCIEDKDTTEMAGSCSQKNVKTETVTSKSKGSRKTQKTDISKGSDVLSNEKNPSVKEKGITEIRSMDSKLDSRNSKESEVGEGSKHILKSNEAFKISTSLPVKGEKEQAAKGSPLMVRVSDIISFTMASKNQKPGLAGGKFNIRMQNTELSSLTGRVKTAESGSSMKTILLKGDKASVLPKAFIKVGEISGQDHFLIPGNSLGQKYPVIDYTDIETQEVVVGGELEDPSSQSMMVGHLPEEMDLMANEELGSSSEEERTKSPEPQCSTKKEALSPEGKVALDHSYSSGSSEGGKVVTTSKKKSLPASCDKPLTSRPVYSSASLAKRSLDIMLHNDKINILRQMSQIFNDEKPIQPEKGQSVSSSEGEGEEDMSIAKARDEFKAKEKAKASEIKKEDKHYTESSVEKDKQTSKSSNQKFLQKKSASLSSNLIPPPTSVKKGHLEGCQEKRQVEEVKVPSKKQETEQAPHCQREIGNSSKKEEEIACFILDMSEDPKVHHVPVYSLVPDEQISVQSSVGAGGEHVDIVDGFSFVSFNSLEELNTYTQKQRGKLDKRHCPWLKRKLKRRKKLLKAKKKGTEEVKNSNEEKGDPSISSEHSQESSSFNISGAFSSNDLDTYLNNNAHLNISYAIPKCKTTEEGVTRLREEELLEDVKRAEPPVSFPNPVPSESKPSETGSNGGSLHTGEMEPLSHDEIHYEEVNAIDILYPKEKYKYYYNKDLCKETKADGSNVFVRRAGKLVPLTSVFKSQRTSMTESKNKKTVELVYVYDGGKLLTLGGSLTKINPSNSDSVRARVILPIGVPPIVKGDAGQTKTKKVQAVEINEDLAKFALSALQNPESKDVKLPEEKNEAKPEIEEKPGSVVEKIETKVDEPKQTVKDKLKVPPKITKVIPTKRNILDIIAAKLAMSDDESEEKEEEIEENQPPRDESPIVGADTKVVQEDTKENVMLKDEDDKSKKAESVKECMTQSDEEDSDIKKSKESDVKKTEIENEDDLKPRMNMDFDSNKTVEDTKQETESSEHEKDNNKATRSNEFENKSFKLCSTGDSECGDEKEVAGGKNKIRAGALNMPHKDGKTDSCINETKKDDRYKETPAAFSRKDSVQAPSQNTGSASDSKSTREILDDGQKVKKLISVPEETEKIEACKGEREIQSSKVASEQTKAEQPVCATEENDSKTRTFKKNMYRFPSLSREMKRLNMNFVNYTMEETNQDDHEADENKIKDVCTHEHCLLGCICDTLSCRRRDPEHCGRVECMFECNCRDESWKHAVSGMGRTMNAVSIFNLDREQKEGLALREKDFKKTVIQTGTEVILVGAERKKRERRIPGRYRDSAVWMGGDLVDMDCTSVTAEPEVPPEPGFQENSYSDWNRSDLGGSREEKEGTQDSRPIQRLSSLDGRFVMIRCDGNAKWEIVGVVQKKGPYVTTKSSEQKSKGKPGLPVPQVVDLEEEERQKEKAKEKPDIVILADSENNGEDTEEKEGGAWEGSLPLIASVHSASDSSIADLMDLKDTAVSISEALPTRTTKEDVSQEFEKSLVPLEGDETPPTPEVEAGVQKKQMTIDTISLKKVKALPDLVPIREPSIDVPSKESIEKTSTDTPISPVGMKTIKINQTSNRIFGDYNIVTSTPFVQSSKCSPLINVTSASSSLCSTNPVISLPGSAEGSKISHTVTSSKDAGSSPLLVQVENTSLISEDEKLVSPLSTKKINLSSPTSSGSAMFRPRIQVTHGKGINPTLQPRMAATSTVNHRMLYIPVSSSGMSKMVLMPSGSSGPSRMLFMSPPNKTPSSGVVQEGNKMKMVIVPSAGDRGKMVILPSHSIDTNVAALPLAAASEKNVETEKKFILLPPSQGLNFTGSLDNKSVSIPSIPTNVPEVNLTENVVSNKLQGTSAQPVVVEETAAQKPENSDDSDDVVVIGTASNTLTITRVKTSEQEVSQLAGISTAPSVMIVPSTTSVVSGGGTAQTTVVSSVSTISSTLPQISQAQDCDIIVPAGTKPPVKDCSKHLKETEDMVIVKTSLNENQLNALLQNTHKDMLKNAECPLDGSDVTHMKKDTSDASQRRDLSGQSQVRKDKSDAIPKKEVAHDNKDKSLSLKCSSKTHSPQAYLKNTSEVQELESRPVPIKKMGYHWSAVDLSLSFKSVKLEWLLGTIRKNVLVNIFRMSQKTQSPVTLSVKNGSSTSMLYGLARTGLSDNKQPLPILILGSIISAVLSSASTTDNMLFHGNAVKYFIREATGELSSYTYDATGEYLVKLASKKRGHCGEMIGIGEKVLLQKMRESNYVSENLLIQSPEKGNHPKKSQESSKKGNTTTQDSAGCSCTASGDFICLGHSTPEMESKSTPQQKPVSQPQSPVVVTYSKGAKDDPLSPSKSLGVTSSTDSKSQNTVEEGELTTVESGVQSCKTLDSYELPIPSVSHSQTGTVISKMETETSPRKPEESSCQQSSAVVAGKDTPQSMKDHVQRDDKTSATGPMAVKEKDETHTVNQSTSNPGNEGRLTSSEADEAEDVDVDIEGESEQGSSMLMQLRQQVASQTITVNKMKGTYNTPGDIARRLLSVSETGRRTGIKRKSADLQDHKYERPCPRSKKKMHQNKPLPAVKGVTEQEPRPGPSGIKQPVKPKQSTPTALLKKKDPLRIQKRFSEIEGIGDERSAVVHNELERMRRRLMSRLFKNLQYWALYTPEQSSADVVPVPKVAVLSIATKVCKEVKEEEIRLTAQEEEVRAERSMLIKRLASTIADGCRQALYKIVSNLYII